MRRLAAIVLVVLVVLGAWWFTREAPRAVEAERQASAAAQPVAEAAERRTRLVDDEPERARRLRDGAARREAMQRQIVTAMATRETAAAPGRSPPGRHDAPAPASNSRGSGPSTDEPAANTMIDRTGNHGYLTRVLSQDLMPLVDECHALVRGEHPDLAGMLVLDLEILGDEDIGGVVNTLEPGKGNEIAEPALLECVRESLLATTLPPPEQGGRDAISLSMRFDPPESK
ncbi:hypothetical protein [Nannocystis radixulma]|uniref:Uncharacterized protein n=1 Tax=Nannocystis radixulma TaxID=2995305 RepID=A0ABT5B275_9BACT|nr:hypothetical protein [Nannocystis radixulma]MDC0667237.1 hypothetical protein [Nannocystis radixulma]